MHEFDLFISHASEDNEAIARPLAQALRDEGYAVWYDEFMLRPGDSLTERIDYGLANSEAGLMIISPAFMRKPWPKRELGGLIARQMSQALRLIPVWHEVTVDDVLAFSPPMADIKALHTKDGIESIADALLSVVKPSRRGRDRGIEIAIELLRRGDWAYAVDVAAAALDDRVHQLHSRKASSATTPTNLTEAISQLNDLNPVTLPSGMSVTELARIAIDAMMPSFAPSGMPTMVRNQLAAEAFLKDVRTFLRANPLHGTSGRPNT